MQRRELKRAIKSYAREVHFYRYGLISKYLKYLRKEETRVLNAVPYICCSDCGSEHIEVEYSDSEYCSNVYLYCSDCDSFIEDTVGYIDAIAEVHCLDYIDEIKNMIWCSDDVDFKSTDWQKYCEEVILKSLSDIKKEG